MKDVSVDKWRELACSDTPQARQLALDLAPAIASEIQSELVLWFLSNDSFSIKQKISPLLNDYSRAIIAADEDMQPSSLLKVEDVKLLDHTDDEALQQVILQEAVRKQAKHYYYIEPTTYKKVYTPASLRKIKDYIDLTKCSLREARITIGSTLSELYKKHLPKD